LKCGKEIFVKPSIYNRKKYCSRECRKTVKIEHECIGCHEKFYVFPSSKKIYCSRKCLDKYRPNVWQKKWPKIYEYANVKCNMCGSLMYRSLKNKNNYYCSQKCYQEYIKNNPHTIRIDQINNQEVFLQILLEIILPTEWIYVGNNQLNISGKNPDYVHKSGNKLIEYYGRYWHRNDNPNERIKFFRERGYECLVIWEDELFKQGKTKLCPKWLETLEKIVIFSGYTGDNYVGASNEKRIWEY
jgi:very-short-patch-repair endonuclease